MDIPVPTHLRPYFAPVGADNCEYEATGSIHCACGGEQFEVWESNDRLIVKLICRQCRKEILLFDSGKHGWDGFVCKMDCLDRTLPAQKHVCPQCGADAFAVRVFISSQGKQDFLDECVSHDPSFSADDWVDGFEWIRISLSCGGCLREEADWVDLETM